VEARAAGAGLDAARAALAQSLEGVGKLAGGDPLRRPAELARALWLAHGYAASKDAKDPKDKAGKVETAVFNGGSFTGAGMAYAYRLPRDYDPTRMYPLILAIPGEDEQPADHIRANWTLKEIQERVILVCPAMPAQRETWERVMVKGRPGGLCHVLTALRLAAERFALDFDRVYVAGRSLGVRAALAAGNYGPQRFAGIIGRAGDAGELAPDNFVALPTFFAGGGPNARAFGEAAKAAGHDNSTFQVDGSEQDVWLWMLDHPRTTYPERIALVPGDPFPTRVSWLLVSPSAPQCRARAALERASNTIRLDTEGMAHATLLLNDAMLDLARPVRVICNGNEQSLAVARQLSSLLDGIYDGTSDPAAVYVARVELDLTTPAAASVPEVASDVAAEFAQRLSAAGSEVAKLWELHRWCQSTQLARQDERVLRAIVRLDPENAGAHEALGHARFANQWFTTPEALERFKQGQDPRAAAARGRVEYKSLWMHPDERALAVKGWIKDQETGLWLTPTERKKVADGWVRQDLEWIEPREAARVDEGLWRVDGEWLDLAHADRRHASVDSMWRIPGAEVQVYATTTARSRCARSAR
jgi:hypothetical protein